MNKPSSHSHSLARKFLPLLLALVMALGLIPAGTAAAAEAVPEPIPLPYTEDFDDVPNLSGSYSEETTIPEVPNFVFGVNTRSRKADQSMVFYGLSGGDGSISLTPPNSLSTPTPGPSGEGYVASVWTSAPLTDVSSLSFVLGDTNGSFRSVADLLVEMSPTLGPDAVWTEVASVQPPDYDTNNSHRSYESIRVPTLPFGNYYRCNVLQQVEVNSPAGQPMYFRFKCLTTSVYLDQITFLGADNALVTAKENLATLIEDAEALKEDSYTAESWAAMQAALSSAKLVSGNADATLEQLNAAIAELDAAVKALERAPFNPDYAMLSIAEVYGNMLDEEGDRASDVGGSHSFVEIYNPNNFAVELDGYSLFYQGYPTQEISRRNGWAGFDLPDVTLPARHSFLINCGQNTSVSGQLRLTADDFDATWPNPPGFVTKGAKYVITYGVDEIDRAIVNPFDTDGNGTRIEGYVDMFGGAGNDSGSTDGQDGYETAYPKADGSSKQKGYVRRDRNTDTDNNADDFVTVDFRSSQSAENLPRSLDDGPFGGPVYEYETIEWPGANETTTFDTEETFLTDTSGLDFHNGQLYVVDNKSNLWIMNADKETGSLSFDEGFEDGSKRIWFGNADHGDSTVAEIGPDSEGITVAGDGLVYVASERDNSNNDVNRNQVLQFNTDSEEQHLVATREWDLTSSLPDVPANAGIEAVEWISFDEINGLLYDESKGKAFDSGDYPKAIDGVFFVAFEDDGHAYGFIFNEDGPIVRIADIDSRMGGAMALDYDAYEDQLWILADNGAGNHAARVEFNGTATVDMVHVAPPSGVNASRNHEGFAIADASYTVGGDRPVYRAEDGRRPGALTVGSIDCEYEPSDELTLLVTSNKETVYAGDEFRVETSFSETQESNVAVLTYKFDADKFEYKSFEAGEGAQKVSVDREQEAEGIIEVTVMVPEYNAKAFGQALFAVREDAELDGDENPEVTVDAEYVLRNEAGEKEIKTISGSTKFTSKPGKPGDTNGDGKIDLIDLSNVIDMFGKTDADFDWDEAKAYDFNNNGGIDVSDIAKIAEQID